MHKAQHCGGGGDVVRFVHVFVHVRVCVCVCSVNVVCLAFVANQ